MSEETNRLVSEDEMREAACLVWTHRLYCRTPLLKEVQHMFQGQIPSSVHLHLKLENMQTTGSFKIRGVLNQMHHLEKTGVLQEKTPITMSAGNYGRAFATYLHSKGIPGRCILPDTAPKSRADLIRSLGVDVEIVPNLELQPTVDRYVEAGSHVFCHPIDDVHLVAGYTSLGMEILEELPAPDIVLVCCGGGGLTAGVAAAIKTLGPAHCRIYAVEPRGAPCMYESFKARRAVSHPVDTVATGLAPPYAGKITYKHCAEFVDSVLLVSDEEILRCVELLYRRGLVVEPSGAAAMAALVHGHVPETENKKVVVVITGGNVTPGEMAHHLPDYSVL